MKHMVRKAINSFVPNFALENEGTALSGAEILQAM
jgi:hypothetical protein